MARSGQSFTQTARFGAQAGAAGCPDPVILHENHWGVIGGVYAGYNWAVDPSWVLGVEAD